MMTRAKTMWWGSVVAVLLGSFLATAVQAAKPPADGVVKYTAVPLVPPDSEMAFTESYAADLDSQGNVVGYFRHADKSRTGFYYDRAGKSYGRLV